MSNFTIEGNSFMLNGEPFRVMAGAMHYFRVPRAYWRDRLLKIKACGFNTIETYTAWNMHEKNEGEFNFSGNLDLKAYLDLIQELGMYAIVRPGPYICSEWEFGGFPWWLNSYDDIELRCMNERYLEKIDKFFDVLIPIIAEKQISRGGNVIMVQVENEYGSYANDKEYIRYLAKGLKDRGIDCLLFTSDGGDAPHLSNGTVPEIFKTANFGSNAAGNFKGLREYQPEGPLMCAEYWNGWFDHWGEKHHHRDADDAAKHLDAIIQAGGNVSVYMMHGGTNFGLMNGANHYEVYEPTVNSYDDDAPVNEYGAMTDKFFAFKKVLASHGFVNEDSPVPEQPVTANYGNVELTECANLYDNLDELTTIRKKSALPMTMEKIGFGYGLINYRLNTGATVGDDELFVEANDRAWIYKDGKYLGCVYVNDKKHSVKLNLDGKNSVIDILVENMGRTNYGHKMSYKKGIVGPVRQGLTILTGWENSALPLDDISSVRWQRPKSVKFEKTPIFLKGSFTLGDEINDTFVRCDGFKKGFIWVNGTLLSRYWEEGPTKTAYLPATMLRKGVNEIVLLETEGFRKPRITLTNIPEL